MNMHPYFIMDIAFYQMLFLHLLRWRCGFKIVSFFIVQIFWCWILNFPLSKIISSSLSFLKDIFTWYGILVWQPTPIPTPNKNFKDVVLFFHASIVSDGKSTVKSNTVDPWTTWDSGHTPPPLGSWIFTYNFTDGPPYPWFQPTMNWVVL